MKKFINLVIKKRMKTYRICERKGDKILTLFHALNGTRVLPFNQ